MTCEQNTRLFMPAQLQRLCSGYREYLEARVAWWWQPHSWSFSFFLKAWKQLRQVCRVQINVHVEDQKVLFILWSYANTTVTV